MTGEERFCALVQENRIGLIGYLARYVDAATAEDLAADAFAALWERLPRLRDEHLRSYLYKAGRNMARNYLRRQRRISSFEELPAEQPSPDPALDEMLAQDEEKRAVHAALATLPPDYRAVLHLLYFAEMQYAEAGRVLGKSPRQMGNLVYRAKCALREALARRGAGEITQHNDERRN